MDSSQVTGAGKPEPTAYDRARHGKMRLRPIGYGYFHINRTKEEVLCGKCGAEVENPVRFHNGIPYHKECYSTL